MGKKIGFYIVPKGCFMQPLVKLGFEETLIWESYNLSQNP
jgi:hypothetical protein